MICVLIKLVKKKNQFLPFYCKIKCVNKDVIIILFSMRNLEYGQMLIQNLDDHNIIT